MRNLSIDNIARLWVLWNAKVITAEAFAMRVGNLQNGILRKEIKKAWREYSQDKVTYSKKEDPLSILLI